MQFEVRVENICKQLTDEGYSVERNAIQYGMQIKVSDFTSVVSINVYNGKKGITITVTGKNSELKKLMEAKLLKPVETNIQQELCAQMDTHFIQEFEHPWIGTDESGKGDFFGPLVVAGVWADRKLAKELNQAGVKDCKLLTDKKIYEIAGMIRQLCSNKYVELELTPLRYNSLYQAMQQEGKNLNHLLAWAHARVIENMLNIAPAEYVLADKFADEAYIKSKLMEKGKNINLIQEHKAERNIAVAAASILARDRFLARLKQLGDEYSLVLPKGASEQVIRVGKEFILQNSRSELVKVGKLHFRTANQILK